METELVDATNESISKVQTPSKFRTVKPRTPRAPTKPKQELNYESDVESSAATRHNDNKQNTPRSTKVKPDPEAVEGRKRARLLTNIFYDMYNAKAKESNVKVAQKDIRTVAQKHAQENMNNPEIVSTYEEHKSEPKEKLEETMAQKMLRKIRGLK
jgi:hypothetical protein